MLKLLKIEWMKVKGYTGFRVFTILYFFAMIGINLIGFYINERITEAVAAVPMGEMLTGTPFSFPNVWQTTTWLNSWLLYFPGILFILLMTNEFNFRTHRQNIIDGMNRKGFINVKFLMAFLFALAGTLMNALMALIIGGFAKVGTFSFAGSEYILYGFIQLLVYTWFALILAVLLRKSGVAIIVFFLFGLIFENILVGLINHKMELSPAGYFMPLQVADSLVDVPLGFFKNIMYQKAPSRYLLIACSLAYAGIYYFFARRKFTREDL